MLVKLEKYLDVRRGPGLASEFYSEEGQFIRLTLGNFNYPNGGFKINTSKKDIYFIGDIKKEYILKKGDLITPLTEQVEGLLGETAWIPEDNKYIQNGDVGLVQTNDNIMDKKYCYYLLSSPLIKKQLSSGAQQTKIRHTSPEKIKDCVAPIPNIEMQRKIGYILSNIDNQIERNNAMVKKLQVLSQAIYNYYFLQYEFPDKNGNPYKKSGGSFVYNNIIDRKIPHGWNVIKLSAECKIRLGGTPDTSVNEYWDGKINWLNSGEIAQFPVTCSELKITQAGVDNSATKLMKKGTVVVSITGNIRASILGLDSCANQSVVGIEETKLLKKSYLYPNIYNQLEHFTSISAGNCQKHINKGTLEKLNIVIPEISVLEDYYNKCERLYNQIISLKQSADKLITLKNKLLPLLINQQLG